MDTLVILIMASGLLSILMFIMFYIYARKSYNEKHLNEDYGEEDKFLEVKEEDIEKPKEESDEEIIFIPQEEEKKPEVVKDEQISEPQDFDMEFVPRKKK